jgi:hypothetical protein
VKLPKLPDHAIAITATEDATGVVFRVSGRSPTKPLGGGEVLPKTSSFP